MIALDHSICFGASILALTSLYRNSLDLFCGGMNERNRENFVLNEAKNVGDALPIAIGTARLFNEVQEKICRL